jgi:hypothetical protein
MQWLLQRIHAKKHDENRSYAAELLSILLQNSDDNKNALGRHDGVEVLLKVLSVSFEKVIRRLAERLATAIPKARSRRCR